MGAKYICNYKDFFDQQCRIEITPVAGWSADPILIKGQSKSACIISHDASDDPYENPIVNSKASIGIIQEGQINILELQEAGDRDFIVSFYFLGQLKWMGFLIPDGVQQLFESTPFELNLVATDGLMLLENVDYSHDNLQGGRCAINYFRRILFATSNLGLNLPLQWVSSLTNNEFPLEADGLSGSVTWSPRGEGFTDYNGNYKSCLYILTELARAAQCRLFQSDGFWKLERINDVVSGSFVRKQISGLSGFSITTSSVNVLKTIAGKDHNPDYSVVEHDHMLTVLPPLKKVITTYEHEQRQNILPNGNMDIVESVFNKPLYWFGYGANIQSVPSLSEARGSGVEVVNYATDSGYLFAPRPPQSVRVPVITQERYILSYFFKGTAKTGDKIYMTDRDLNGVDVNGYSYTVPALYNNDTAGALNNMASTVPGFFTTPAVTYNSTTEEYEFKWTANIKRIAGEQTITTVSLSTFSFDGYLPIDTDILYETINLGFKFVILNGYVLNEFGNIDWANTPNQIRVTYQRGATTFYLNEFGFWVAQLTNIQIDVPNLKPNDVAQVDFNAKQDIKMPLPDVTPIGRTNPPQIKIEFLLPSGRRVQYDDVYMTVADNNNVTKGTVSLANNSNTKANEYTLKISSAHSGFYVSNFMTNYDRSGVQKFWSDSKFSGTLTDINTHAILRNRYKSSLQFDGSIYGPKFSYGEIYTIDTLANKKFLPLKTDWNTETNVTKINCLEVRDDNININLERYGSIDNGSEQTIG